MMMSISPQEGEDPFDRALRTHRLSLGAIVTIVVQTIGLVIWLVQLGADVKQLRHDVTVLQSKLDSMDDKGTRALDAVRTRQTDVVANNATQEQHLREIDTKHGVLDRRIVEIENKALAAIAQQQADLKRLDDQIGRTVQTIDSIYNLLNDHLRNHPKPPSR